MNKLLLSGEDETNNLVIDVDTELIIKNDKTTRDICVVIESNTCLRVLELSVDSKESINFILKENARLIYDRAISNPKDEIIVNLDGDASSLELRNSVISKVDSYCNFEIRHNANKTTSKLLNHGVNNSANRLDFKIDAYVPSITKDCITDQENKILNTKCGRSAILPNLIIDTDQVVANHSAFIGNFDNEVVFYLKSRGLNSELSQKLLMNGFLFGNISYDERYQSEIENIFKI